jgi:thioredoxin 1
MAAIAHLSRDLSVVVAAFLLPAIVTCCGSAAKSFRGLANEMISGEQVEYISVANVARTPADHLRGTDNTEQTIARAEDFVPQNTSRVKLNSPMVSKEMRPMTQSNTLAKEMDSAQRAKVEHVDASDFKDKVLASDLPVLVDFYADWCAPCRILTPVLDQVARDTPGAKVVKVNIDHSPQLARKYHVTAVPTMIVFKNGVPVAHRSGLADKGALQKLLAH